MNRVDRAPTTPPPSPLPSSSAPTADANAKTQRLTLTFSVDSRIDQLTECLSALKPFDVSLARIESRPSLQNSHEQDIFVELLVDEADLIDAETLLNKKAKNTRILRKSTSSNGISLDALVSQVPVFPRCAADLDDLRDKVILDCEELEPDHPGVCDPAYRKRRREIATIAQHYLHGQPLPRIEYTPTEVETWWDLRAVYRKAKQLYATHACREFRENFAMLERCFGYSEDNIPQQADIAEFLKERTGFTMRPVMGLLTSRQFLNALAFRVFCATQYIRHHSTPFYSIEPDLCHELLGHVALLADPDYAAFCQEIGLASLGATDEEIEKLSALFMYTVEFGLCRDNGEIRAYGAGILASTAELEHCLSDKATQVPLDPHKAAVQKYPIVGFQPVYFVADSLADVQVKVREFIATLSRPFDLRYDPDTETVVPVRKSTARASHRAPIAPAM
ncbi:Biopterin-dependent aromatic amino acid hydroxylase-domain-containing protein [Syncephalis pseudoplumigaleata]|uniref:phenylalanine 4-monooxygenase n=1 Tax=Syncephalis pseudoplumigaleata TaxID=1712513 RepID=A0A4P9Z509_9FUNG|nr:Biopterin-dependent aromatic amino acid hydroxylase-domain-containing protein [Syncephalis pseudoplumigaleata]|eukprot:RKP27162.1 Biopterin-dependent aromatic amino acid hydroxylase-domain-containing protein [Syncephalis pseudoplumigaleata]